MNGLKLIFGLIFLIILSYIGVFFVEANKEPVFIVFGNYHSPAVPLGFVILTSALFGMVVACLIFAYELIAMYMTNRNLRKKIKKEDHASLASEPDGSLSSESAESHASLLD